MQTALIVGGDSTIGAKLAAHLRGKGWDVSATSRRAGAAVPFDLTKSPDGWPDLPSADAAFLCAAITKLDICEDDPGTTSRINVTHLGSLAEKLLARGSYVVALSTNQVFDGEKPYADASDPVSPRSAYGSQKAQLEKALLAYKNAAVLRLTKVISGRLPILDKWTQALLKGESVEAFTDLVFAPLPIAEVLAGLEYLGTHRPRGIFQLSGVRDVSYYEIACALAKTLGVDEEKVMRTSAATAGIRPQFLPRHGTLRQSDIFAAGESDPIKAVGVTP